MESAAVSTFTHRAPRLRVAVASEAALDVRQFSVHERMSALFEVDLVALSEDPDLDFEAIIGHEARFAIRGGLDEGFTRSWTGICHRFEQIGVEEKGLSTYRLGIVPSLWLTTQRRNHRMFQQKSEVEIVLQLLEEWGVDPEKKLSGTYKKRKYRVQYGESDFTFLRRMLEDVGVSFYFSEASGQSRIVLADMPQTNEPREHKLPFRDDVTVHRDLEHVTAVHVGRQVRPGRYTMRDHDYRKDPRHKLLATEAGGDGIEARLERFHYTPGAFLFESDKGESTPTADDKGRHRTDERDGAQLARKRLQAKRGDAKTCSFETNAYDLAPGVVIAIVDHPRRDLAEDRKLLIVESTFQGTSNGAWSHRCEARSTEGHYRPPMETPKPKVSGVESATVVGPAGEEIHTDEFGRVRVHFHWDRESRMDENSSCWIHVSQPWGGAGYGGTNLPRIGQEVIVDFLSGDPDRPILVGRVYTNLQKTPYTLPANKTQSGWKSNSTGGSGGYNEIMFEDAGGKELVRMQAQKDHHKLVKHDEQGAIGNNRSKSVGNDDSISVGNDRSSMVGSNNAEIVGGNEAVTVGGNQAVTVGGNQTISVTGNQTEGITGNRGCAVTGNDTLAVTGTQGVTITGAQTSTFLATQGIKVSADQAIKVGGTQGITVTGAQTITCDAVQTLTAPTQVITAKGEQSQSSTTHTLKASASSTTTSPAVTVNSSTLVLNGDGTITIKGGAITIEGGTIGVKGGAISINGSPVDVNGGPLVNVSAGVIKLN
jgi:type VI secretion system secreted protein VgrG